METPTISRMMDNLAVQLDQLQMTSPVAEPVAKRDPAPVIPVPPPKVQMEEPLVLGGADAPIIAEPVSSHTMTVRMESQPMVAQPQKRKRFGLFGFRRTEREEYVEPRIEVPAPAAPRQQVAPTAQAPTRQTATASQPLQASAPTARAPAEPPRQQQAPSPDDLFAGVSEDERFEIPAFLRRQANSGG
jgi:hypothetical protein